MEGRCAVHARANGLGTDTWQDMSTTRPRPLRYAPEDAALLLSRLAQKESALRYAPSAEALLLSGASLCQAAALAADSPPRGGGGGAAGGGTRPRRSAPRSRRESDGGAAARRASGPGQNAAPLRSEPARDLANRRAGRPLPYKALLQVSLPSQLSSSWTPLLGAVSEPSRKRLGSFSEASRRCCSTFSSTATASSWSTLSSSSAPSTPPAEESVGEPSLLSPSRSLPGTFL